MAIDRINTTEAFSARNGSVGNVNVEEVGRIVAVKGRKFWEDFIEAGIVPHRREIAMMYAAQVIGFRGEPGDAKSQQDLVDNAWDFADRFTLADKASLEKNVAKYFEQYMSRGDLDELLQAGINAAKDFSA